MKNSANSCLVSLLLLSLCVAALAGIIEDVRNSIAQKNYPLAEKQLRDYRAQNGDSPEALEALSWLGRGALSDKRYDKAIVYARQAEKLSLEQLKRRPLDAEPHLPTALGAAFEVEAQAEAAKGNRAEALALLHHALKTYYATSIRTRIQKNLNLLGLEGKPAPALEESEYLGPRPASLDSYRGHPVLLFFWAHWCADCKHEEPVLEKISAEFQPKGLAILGPTQRYGYAARGEEATPQAELKYIEDVRQKFYAGLSGMPVSVSQENFKNYGASTTPTLVLLDRHGRVAEYHPGFMGYDDLRARIDKLLAP
jgi:thiol-disulfide isomerase/thioredoxin